MKAADLRVVEEAKRTAHGQFSHYYKVMGTLHRSNHQASSQGDKKKPEPAKQNRK
jgi:hypothetical protein